MRVIVFKMNGCIYCPLAIESAKQFGKKQGLEVEERSAVKHFGELARILKGHQVAIPMTCIEDNAGKIKANKCVVGAEDLERRLEIAFNSLG